MDASSVDCAAHTRAPEVRSSAADRVYAHVRTAILSRRFADHDLLAEGRIAEETGVSRTPVREALLRLEAEGMVRLLPKRGALVLPVTAQEAREILATRELVETHCVRQVIGEGRGPTLAQTLDGPLDALATAAADGLLHEYVTADRDFHATIVDAAGNSILSKLYGGLRDRQLRMGGANLLDPLGRLDTARAGRTLGEHRGIREAIAAGDAELACQLTTRHLATAALALT
ncbi:FCD domain-containing protein [Nakamurella sp. YIM 132087]|uniref:FCD domain-containing protein n=1 Tax=Nakamurella alba TaxID=2665158 RepID=A0A7K1FHX7_9ACTN|nr:GntR family transcriptional regulator [Nakamurella alba]MTD13721.1 FCD domain-containing protein [Nakamurella alba]